MIAIGGESATASGVAPTSDDASQYPVHSLAIEGCVYRGEGNANLVVAVPAERKVIRLRKSASASGDEGFETRAHQEHEEAEIRREASFIRGVISGFLGPFVRAPEVRRYARPEIARLADQIRPRRPESRRDKDLAGEFAAVYPDYSLLPEELAGLSAGDAKPTFCLEIKPKQGFVPAADTRMPRCPYCLTQFHKLIKGGTRKSSGYCPLDLFSGDARRMDRALEALLRSPQNNLRIFKDGRLVYGDKACEEETLRRVLEDWFGPEDPVGSFKKLARTALTRGSRGEVREPRGADPEALPGVEVPSRLEPGLLERARELLSRAGEECNVQRQSTGESCLSVGSVIERILRMQRVHRCGADVVAWIHAKLAAHLDDELIYGCLTENCQDVQQQQQQQQHQQRGVSLDSDQLREKGKKDFCDVRNEEPNADLTYCGKRQISNLERIVRDELPRNLTTDDCINILKNYLLFVTARDCSILIAFQEADRALPATESVEHQIIISKDQTFLFSIRVLDLDMKSLSCIEKHRRRDNDVLQSIIKVLEQRLNL